MLLNGEEIVVSTTFVDIVVVVAVVIVVDNVQFEYKFAKYVSSSHCCCTHFEREIFLFSIVIQLLSSTPCSLSL